MRPEEKLTKWEEFSDTVTMKMGRNAGNETFIFPSIFLSKSEILFSKLVIFASFLFIIDNILQKNL